MTVPTPDHDAHVLAWKALFRLTPCTAPELIAAARWWMEGRA